MICEQSVVCCSTVAVASNEIVMSLDLDGGGSPYVCRSRHLSSPSHASLVCTKRKVSHVEVAMATALGDVEVLRGGLARQLLAYRGIKCLDRTQCIASFSDGGVPLQAQGISNHLHLDHPPPSTPVMLRAAVSLILLRNFPVEANQSLDERHEVLLALATPCSRATRTKGIIPTKRDHQPTITFYFHGPVAS